VYTNNSPQGYFKAKIVATLGSNQCEKTVAKRIGCTQKKWNLVSTDVHLINTNNFSTKLVGTQLPAAGMRSLI